MHSFLDSKHMAKALRQALAERGQEISHSDALELAARQFGFANWNMLSARIEAAQLTPLELPSGWHVASHTNEGNYRLGIDPKLPGTALIESRPDRSDAIDRAAGETAVLMQSILADPYRGGRLKLTAELRSEDAETATLWMRVDQAEGRYLRFDNLLRPAAVRSKAALAGPSGTSCSRCRTAPPPSTTASSSRAAARSGPAASPSKPSALMWRALNPAPAT